jgi:CubicO group peptidase (beta-lactamase class C family)
MITENKLSARIGAVAGKVPGVALVVVGPEGIRARASTGFADLSSRTPMSTELAAPWFSMTKIATATLALRQAEAGILELDEPVAQLVPQLGLLQPSKWAERITPRHLLQHSAGLRNPLPVKWVHPAAGSAPDQGHFLQALLTKNGKLRTEPGARTNYSNLGALILAAAMTARSGESFEALMQTNILDPLGMLNSGFDEVQGADRATGYHPRRNPLRYFLPGWVVGETSGRWLALNPFAVDGPPYGGLVGTADDAARFLQMHVADGSCDGEQILRPEVAAEMRRITMRGKRYDLGLGWFRPARQRNSVPDFVQHLGGGAGFFNCMRIYPTEGVGVVVIGNATKYDIDAVAELALEFRS